MSDSVISFTHDGTVGSDSSVKYPLCVCDASDNVFVIPSTINGTAPVASVPHATVEPPPPPPVEPIPYADTSPVL